MKKITTPKIPDIRKPENSRHVLKLPKPEKLFYSSPKARVGERSRSTVGGTILHCQNGPAVVFQDDGFEWWRNGQVHRGNDLPAVHIGPTSRLAVSFHTGRNNIGFDGVSDLQPNTDLWCVDGFLHRDGKPALVTTNLNGVVTFEEYWCNGRRHRSSGPATTTPTLEGWFYHGLYHRENGPAYVERSSTAPHDYWLWYGDRLMTDSKIDSDFPFAKPPPSYLLTALLSANFSTELVESSLLLLSKHVDSLVPGFDGYISCAYDELSWELAKAQISKVLNPVKSEESLPLPDGILDFD